MLLLACQRPPAEDSQKDKDKEEDKIIINVEADQSFLGDSQATFRSTAVLEADRAATVTTKTSGIILDVVVEEGDLVKQGDVLLVLESDEQQLSLQSAQANYKKSLSNYERAKQLVDKGLTNQEQLDNLRFETEALKASLDQAKMNLSFTKVRAPFDGVVVKRHVKIGNLIQNATAVFDVVDFGSLQAKIDVPEHHWSIMKAGLEVKYEFDALNEQIEFGKVIRVSPMVDSSTGTFEVTVSVDNQTQLLRPGLFAKAYIIYDQRSEAVLVNKDAVIREDDNVFVFVADGDDKVIKKSVSLGYEMDDTFEITAGLDAGEVVITTGKNNLTPDSHINIVNYDASL
ncbi:efflux RND transporter periplasmic adaptor subunit [Marinicella sediminis]|uniref:Efflux RND transporter periplasmic adaptor subunit n=1 Tax=Marinicella sediminis TaxID=1792834 RepID=A0ABV7JAU0_9GAMM|nr:efflux RND transporter periplasmic adaptor subunit [Marinicella sediminis]